MKHLKLLIYIQLITVSHNCYSQNLNLINAFAHNDYWHKRPLYDALDNGYTNIEADIYLRHSQLVVAHILPFLRRQKTLELLYFEPLSACIAGKNKQATCPALPLMLMIDIKSEANSTYLALQQLLEKYRAIVSGYENGKFVQRQITVVITGHKPYDIIKTQSNRLAFIDDDLMQVRKDTVLKDLYQTASCKYSKMLKWTGKGALPFAERQKLCSFVTMAHKFGKKVRLWASPENVTVWKELLSCGVDLINTDKLAALKNFLTSDARQYAKAD